MNKNYLLSALLLLVGSGLSAQRLGAVLPQAFVKPGTLQAATPMHLQPYPSTHQRDGDVAFSEDFANGFAGNNGGVGPWTVSGANGTIWRYTHTGPNGAYSDPSEIIASPTVANGFMIFNSDSANTNFSVTPPAFAASPAYFTGSLISPVIDLSATPDVELRFAQRMRYCCKEESGHYVDVSTDGGLNWSTRIAVDVNIPFCTVPNSTIATNDDPGTRMYQINLVNAISADPAHVRIRFTEEATADNDLNSYHWQIDDIQVVTLPTTDMRLYTSATTYWNFDVASSFDSVPYTIFPISELRGRTLTMGYFNNGSQPATNVQAHFTTDDGYDQTVDIGDVAPGAADTARVPQPGWTPTPVIGDHNVQFALTADGTDEVPADNTSTGKITVSDYIYARDDNSRDGGYNDTDNGTPFKLGNKFHTVVPEMLYGIDVAFSIASATDIELNAQLTLIDAEYTPIAETGYHTLVDADRSPLGGHKFISFIFDEPYALDPGDYMVCVQHFGGANLLVGTSGVSPEQTSVIYQETSDTWFFVTATPMVRMNFNPTIGIAENEFHNGIGLGQNYPNPSNTGSTRIDYSLEQSAMVDLELRDVSGKTVQTLESGNRAPGVHHVDVNTANLDAGVYFYTLTTNNAVSTKRMTVVR